MLNVYASVFHRSDLVQLRIMAYIIGSFVVVLTAKERVTNSMFGAVAMEWPLAEDAGSKRQYVCLNGHHHLVAADCNAYSLHFMKRLVIVFLVRCDQIHYY